MTSKSLLDLPLELVLESWQYVTNWSPSRNDRGEYGAMILQLNSIFRKQALEFSNSLRICHPLTPISEGLRKVWAKIPSSASIVESRSRFCSI